MYPLSSLPQLKDTALKCFVPWLKSKPLLLIGATILLSSCYYLEVARIQGEIWWNQIPLDEAIHKSSSPEEKRKLLLVQELIHFVENELQIDSKGNYQSYCPLQRPQVSFLLSACKKWSLEPKQWNYLVVGTLPYRGYRLQQDAEREAQYLDARDYDTYIRPVTAYSTLGWFKDPILSTMLTDEVEVLVETVIHELIHGEIFLKNAADFNEALATYMGVWGAQLFFAYKQQDERAQKLGLRMREKIRFSHFLNQVRKQLEQWYQNFPHQKQEALRQQQFNNFITTCKQQGFSYCHILSNNARILAFGTYYSEIEKIDRWLKKQGNLSFAEALAKLKKILVMEKQKPETLFETTK